MSQTFYKFFKFFILPLVLTCFTWFSGVWVFSYLMGTSFTEVRLSIEFAWNLEKLIFLEKLILLTFTAWFFVSTYNYSSQNFIVLIGLFYTFGLFCIFSCVGIEIKFYITQVLWFYFCFFINGCFFFGGFSKFTTLLADKVLEKPHVSFNLINFCLWWKSFINDSWPVHIAAFAEMDWSFAKLRYYNYLIYCGITTILLVFFGFFFSNLLVCVIAFSLFVGWNTTVLVILIKFCIAGIGFTVLCFDTVWATTIESFISSGALHRLAFNNPGASIKEKAYAFLKGTVVSGFAHTTEVFTSKPAAAAANAAAIGGLFGGGVAAGKEFYDHISGKSNPSPEASSQMGSVDSQAKFKDLSKSSPEEIKLKKEINCVAKQAAFDKAQHIAQMKKVTQEIEGLKARVEAAEAKLAKSNGETSTTQNKPTI